MADPAELVIIGLGPAGLDRLPGRTLGLLNDSGHTVVARTRRHPAVEELAATRPVVDCDDLYDHAEDFDDVYASIVERVVDALGSGPVIYAVPGSAAVGERAVRMLVEHLSTTEHRVELIPGESFLDLVWARTGCDPITDSVQVLDGRNLPDPLPLHLPTVITQVDSAAVMADVALQLGRKLPDETSITVLDALGSPEELVITVELHELIRFDGGPRTSLFLDPPLNGWHGLVTVSRILRQECPWDAEQTHRSLVPHLIEETYEVVDAIDRLGLDAPDGEPDLGVYAEVEEELGDLLLQVVIHATLAEETGSFTADEVAEMIKRKLVHRHPHVFGDVVAEDVGTVSANWEQIKAAEKQRESLMDDVPEALPALQRGEKLQRRAASVGFDWSTWQPVLDKLAEETAELTQAIDDDPRRDRVAVSAELGDVLFTVVNLARHLGVDSEAALRGANGRFTARFRQMESIAVTRNLDFATMDLVALDHLWNEAKSRIETESDT